MSNRGQHGFTITIEIIEHGDFSVAYASVLEMADKIIDRNGDELAVVVEQTGHSLFEGIPAGQAFCEGCVGHTIPGVRWPTGVDGDTSREWVERCDTCERYASDEEARERVQEVYRGAGATITYGLAFPAGSANQHHYINVEP